MPPAYNFLLFFSSSSIISIALIFGAPLTVPAGKPESNVSKKINNLTVKSFLNSNDLNIAIQSSDLIISRSGYSTIMDLQKLEKKAVFVPTPGQTEQEFLANYLKEKKICYSIHQNDIDLDKIFKKSKKYSGFSNSKKSNKIKWEDLFSLF